MVDEPFRGNDRWDDGSRGLDPSREADLGRLVRLAREFLVARGDQALGLGPVRLLSRKRSASWLLFWSAARRIDDALERGERDARDVRARLGGPLDRDFGERCLAGFFATSEDVEPSGGWRPLLTRGLRGLEAERVFKAPRPVRDYLKLLRLKSAPAMEVLDRLLFEGAEESLLARHAELFAASTQIGDDCRDVVRDLAHGRCFVTVEELHCLEAEPSQLARVVRSAAFARLRASWSWVFLEAARDAAAGLGNPADVERARRLDVLWRAALESDQVRPTNEPLRLPALMEPREREPSAVGRGNVLALTH